MKFLKLAVLLLLPFLANAQDEIEFISEVSVAPRVSAGAPDNQTKALYDYAAKTLNMKSGAGRGQTTVNAIQVKDSKGIMHQLSTTIESLQAQDPNNKATAAIITITDQTNGKSYKAILYDKTGDGDNVEEFKVSAANNGGAPRVAGVTSFIRCVLSCSGKSAVAIAHCRGAWSTRLRCIITSVGYTCYAKCAWKLLW
jgi:hypothetical protein